MKIAMNQETAVPINMKHKPMNLILLKLIMQSKIIKLKRIPLKILNYC